MLKKAITLFICAGLLSFSGCAIAVNDSAEKDKNTAADHIASADEDGTIHYRFDEDYSETDPGALVKRTFEEKEFTPADGDISKEEAIKILDSCGFSEFALPDSISRFSKLYNGVVEIGTEKCYSFLFYAEKGAEKLFVGREAIVSADGSKVYARNILGTSTEITPGSSKDDKELYKTAEISPEEALFVINKDNAEKLGLTEDMPCYSFEFAKKLYDAKSVSCYKITPVLEYEHSKKHCSAIYIAADGSGSIIMADPRTGDFEIIV